MAFSVGGWDWTKSGGDGNWGMGANAMTWSDIRDAQAQGASLYQLHQLFDRANREGIHIGKGVAPNLEAGKDNTGPRPSTPIDFGAYGGWGFGKKDLEHVVANAPGGGLQRVKEARASALSHGLNIGWEVDDWMSNRQQEIRDEKQMQWMNEQTMAAQAAQAARDEKQAAWNAQILKEQREHQTLIAAEQQAMNERMARVRTSSPTGVGGSADFRGSRLTTTTSGGGRGPARFSRVTQPLFMNAMNPTGQTSKGTVNL